MKNYDFLRILSLLKKKFWPGLQGVIRFLRIQYCSAKSLFFFQNSISFPAKRTLAYFKGKKSGLRLIFSGCSCVSGLLPLVIFRHKVSSSKKGAPPFFRFKQMSDIFLVNFPRQTKKRTTNKREVLRCWSCWSIQQKNIFEVSYNKKKVTHAWYACNGIAQWCSFLTAFVHSQFFFLSRNWKGRIVSRK